MKEKGKQAYTIKIHLDQEDGKGLAKAAGRVGLTVSELLGKFHCRSDLRERKQWER